MSDKQIEKIKALIDQGATEGERTAAKEALKRKLSIQEALKLDQSILAAFSVKVQVGDREYLMPVYSILD